MDGLEAIDELLGPETDYDTPEGWRNNILRRTAVQMVEMEQLQTAVGPAADLHRAIRADSRSSVAEVLAALPETERRELLEAPLAMGLPPLHHPCLERCVQAVEELLDAGAPLEVVAPRHGTPLHVAAVLHSPDVVELLLSRGANALALDEKGRDPLEACIEASHFGSRQHEETFQRCISLLEAAVDAAPPELRRAGKSNMACDHCGAQGELKRCSGCSLAWYCNAQCFKLAWPVHKQRCQVAQEMRRRLEVLADLSKPSKERGDAVRGVTGSLEAARLAEQLHALKLLEPVVAEDKPTCLGPPDFPQHIPSIMANVDVLSVAGSTPRAWDAPVPSLVQQFCALELPERVLERLCKEDAPAKDLQRAAAVLCMLSCCKFGQALPRQLVKCGSVLRVARLLCALPWDAADGPSRSMLIYVAGVLGGLLEAERRAPEQQPPQRQRRRQQQAGTALEQLLLSEQPLLEACLLTMHAVNKTPLEVSAFVATLYGSPATLQRWLQPNSCPAAVRLLLSISITAIAEGGTPGKAAVGVDWLAFLLECKPGFFVQFMPFLKAARVGQPMPHDVVESYELLLVHVVQKLASALATGWLPDSCDCVFKHLEQLPRNAAILLLALLGDLRGELRAACRAAVTAQQLRAAAAAVEQRGDMGAAEVARLLRAAAALV